METSPNLWVLGQLRSGIPRVTWTHGVIAWPVWQGSLNQVQPHQHGFCGPDPDTELGTVFHLSTDPGQPCLRLQNVNLTSFAMARGELQLLKGDTQA